MDERNLGVLSMSLTNEDVSVVMRGKLYSVVHEAVVVHYMAEKRGR